MTGDPFDEALALANDEEQPATPRQAAAEGGPPAKGRAGTGSRAGAKGRAGAGCQAEASPPDRPRGETAGGRAGRASPSWSEARAIARRTARRPLPSVTRPLDQALDQVLAAPLPARTDLPPFDTSAMDGWAVAGPGPWRLPEGGHPGVLAGHTPEPLPDGHAISIATGARIPPGATAVLRYEYGALEAAGSRLRTRGASPLTGTDIRPRGQECRSGDHLLPADTLVSPAVLGLAAAAGYDVLTVTPRPRVDILVLGDELLSHGEPRDGRIRDALGPMLPSWLAALGADTTAARHLGDDATALRGAVTAGTADLIVTTGGTASGPVDHVHATLRRIGATLLVDGVAVRPGHPMLLATLPDGTPLVGLPGNPLAAVSGLLTLVEPLLGTLANRPRELAPPRAVLTEDVTGHLRDTRLVPVLARGSEGTARPLRYAGPAMLRGVATASHLAVIPPGGGAGGSEVRLLPLPWA